LLSAFINYDPYNSLKRVESEEFQETNNAFYSNNRKILLNHPFSQASSPDAFMNESIPINNAYYKDIWDIYSGMK